MRRLQYFSSHNGLRKAAIAAAGLVLLAAGLACAVFPLGSGATATATPAATLAASTAGALLTATSPAGQGGAPTLPPSGEISTMGEPAELFTLGEPAAALLPSAQADLGALSSLPHYIIGVTVDPDLSGYRGSLRLDYTNPEEQPLQQLVFRLLPNGGKSFGNGELAVEAARLNGRTATVNQSPADRTVLELELPAALGPGDSAQIEIDFAGKVPVDFGGGANPDGYGIFNLTDEVLSISTWYPILSVYDEDGWNLDPVSAIGDSVYSETAFYSVRICTPPEVVLAATGVVVDRSEDDTGECTQLESGPVRDFFVIAGPNFKSISREVDGVTINSYYLPQHEEPAQEALAIAVDALHIYNERFGLYPYKELDVIDAPMRNALGVEFPGIILVSTSLYDTPEQPEFAMATAHEVAHQWWYGVVGNDIFEEPWLDEGLTSFSATLYFEFARSKAQADGFWDFWQSRYERLKDEGRDDPVAQSLAYFEEDPGRRSYSTVVYIKGALFFQALRQEIGDPAFFAALQLYYQAKKYGVAHGEDLLTAFETAAGRSLDDLFETWLFAR